MQWMVYLLAAFLLSLIWSYAVITSEYLRRLPYVKRMGGVGIILSFLLSLWLAKEVVLTAQIWAIIIGAGFILIFGWWDDWRELSWKNQLAFQILLGILLVWLGYRIDYISHPLGGVIEFNVGHWQVFGHTILVVSSLVIIGWLVTIMNAMNWADGIDGLSGGISLLALMAIFLVSLRPEVNQPAVAILCLILVGSVLGFWWFNFPPGKIEAGTSGSFFMGFVLAALAIMAGTKIATALIVLSLPLIDALWVIGERLKEGKSIFQKDMQQRHLHYRLRKLGWSDRFIVLSYLGFLAVMLVLSLLLVDRWHKLLLLVVEISLVLAVLIWVRRRETSLMSKT